MSVRQILACILLLFVGLGHAAKYDASKGRVDSESAQHLLHNISSDISLPFTSETKRLIDTYTYSYRPGAKRIMERGQVYFPSFDYKLEKFGLPKVLKNISIVESNLDVWSVSSKGAVGVWQLMPHTARAHGLKIDVYVDERFDPILSSEVAFAYLSDLYQYFQDWNLALTAYNCGPLKLRKAIREVNSYDLSLIRKVLPLESSRYISRFAAASYLTNYFNVHNIQPDKSYAGPELGSIKIFDYITYGEIANITGLTTDQIAQFNPAIFYNYLPASASGYHLNLPVQELSILIETKGWSYTDIHDVHYLLPSLEKVIPFVNPEFKLFKPFSQGEKNEGEKDSSESMSEVDALAVLRKRYRGKILIT